MVHENKRFSGIPPSVNLSGYPFYIRSCDDPHLVCKVSIVICTYQRESLNETLQSLKFQTFKDFEVILITEKGNLSELRQKGLECSKSDLVSFIDDDVYCTTTWLQGVVESFKGGIVGVTGPTVILPYYQKNRDLFKYRIFRFIYERLFCDGLHGRPSYLSSCGTPSTASNNSEVRYDGEAGYLEACNFTVNRKQANDCGGFDRSFSKTAEWHEVDFALRLKKQGTLWYSQKAYLLHRPSKQGIYSNRLKTRHRWENFMLFQRRWIKPSIKAYLYRGFVWTYLKLKDLQMI